MTDKEKIKKYLDSKGISKNKFYNQTGLSIGFLDSGKSVGLDKVRIIINAYPDLNIQWLLTGSGDMIKAKEEPRKPNVNDVKGAYISNDFHLRTDRNVEHQHVPLYDLDATAGLVALFVPEKQIPLDYIYIPDMPVCDGAIRVTGDSMYPLLKSGDIILYKQTKDLQYGILWGEIYLISYDIDGEEYIMVKYVQKSAKEGCIKLVSYNPHHSPTDIPLGKVRAMALVKASVRYNTIK